MRRLARRLVPAFALVGCALALYIAFAPAGRASPAAPLRGTDVFPAGVKPAPAFTLSDQNGKPVSMHLLKGKVVALTFLDAVCAKECPIVGRELALAQRRLPHGASFVTVVVSVSSSDTPRQARSFMAESGMHGPWHWLFGSVQTLKPVWDEYGIWVHATRSDVLHTAALYLIDRRGSVRVADAIPVRPAQFASSITALNEQ